MNAQRDGGERHYRLLVVEDDEVDRIAVVRALSGIGSNVEIMEATDVASGTELLLREAFDCALVDYRLPDGTAVTLVDRVHAAGKNDVAIVILTLLDDEDVAMEALHHGAQDYILKTPAADQLWRAIRYAIERKKVQALQEHLAQVDRLTSIGQLAAGVAHEVNNPAAFVLTNLALLEEHFGVLETVFDQLQKRATLEFSHNERDFIAALLREHDVGHILVEARKMLQDNLVGMDRIRSIAKDLKNFSRIERDEAEWVQLNDMVNIACKMVANEVRHRASLVKELGPLPYISADRGKLSQAVLNLLINAAHSIEEGAAETNRITVRTTCVDHKLVLTVEDTGCGIAQEDLPHVFKPFFTTKARGVGTGLGLSLTTETIRKHGGTITVDSTLGKGSRFEMVLPEQTGLAVAPSIVGTRGSPVAGERIVKILLIDDDPMILAAFRRILRPHDVTVANGGREAIAVVEGDTSFDVVLCDLMMPEMDGPMFYEALGRIAPELQSQVVFISGGAFTPRAKDFLAVTQALVLDKPIERQKLLAVVVRVAATKWAV